MLALITALRRLRHYFNAHPIVVLTSTPLKAALRMSDFSGRMEKWYVELGRFHIEYEPITAIEGQILADFIVEFTDDTTPIIKDVLAEIVSSTGTPLAPTGGEGDGVDSAEATKQGADNQVIKDQDNNQSWTLFIDGSFTRDGS